VNLNSFDVIKDKVVRDGKVAVLVSPGFGAGWYTWNQAHPELLFLPRVVEMVLNGTSYSEIESYVNSVYGEHEIYTGGASDLKIEWIPQGAQFQVEEYDGSESLRLKDSEDWITA
jgi:hypothetical protein